MAAITLNTFKRYADMGRHVTIESTDNDTLKATGFFRRIFGSAGTDAQRNKATMDDFLDCIRDRYGEGFRGIAKTVLGARYRERQALRGHVVRDVFKALKQKTREIAENNAETVESYLHPDGIKTLEPRKTEISKVKSLHNRLQQHNKQTIGLFTHLNLRGASRVSLPGLIDKNLKAPVGDLLRKNDLRSLEVSVKEYKNIFNLREDEVLTPARLYTLTEYKFSPAIQSLDRSFLTYLNTITDQGIPNLVDATVVKAARPFFFTHDVRGENRIQATFRISQRLVELLQNAPNFNSTLDHIRFLHNVQNTINQAFTQTGLVASNDPASSEIISLAITIALKQCYAAGMDLRDLNASVFHSARMQQALGETFQLWNDHALENDEGPECRWASSMLGAYTLLNQTFRELGLAPEDKDELSVNHPRPLQPGTRNFLQEIGIINNDN